jgi:hypothetical protein
MFKILCQVSGGVTGTREAWLKRDGVEIVFATADEAEAEANRLREHMNANRSGASFHYTPMEVSQ